MQHENSMCKLVNNVKTRETIGTVRSGKLAYLELEHCFNRLEGTRYQEQLEMYGRYNIAEEAQVEHMM